MTSSTVIRLVPVPQRFMTIAALLDLTPQEYLWKLATDAVVRVYGTEPPPVRFAELLAAKEAGE